MTANRLRLWCLVTALAVASVPGAPVKQWFDAANDAYRSERYDTAAAYYQKVIDAGMVNTAVFFNLGNAYYRQNRIGLAILFYERARKLSPTDPDVLANIRFANRHIVDRPPVPERGFLETVVWRLHVLLSLRAQLWTVWALLMALSVLFVLALNVSRNVRLWVIYLGVICALLAVSLGTSAGVKIHDEERTQEAVVLDKSVDARNQPDGTKILFAAHEGTKFRIRKVSGGWFLVSLPNGVGGWIESSSVERI